MKVFKELRVEGGMRLTDHESQPGRELPDGAPRFDRFSNPFSRWFDTHFLQLLRLLVAQQTISACGTLKPGIDAAGTFDEDAFCNDGALQRLGQCATISHGRRAG